MAERGGRYTITDVYVHDTFFQLAYNLDSFVVGSSLLEITSKLAQTGEENLSLFKLLLTALKVMAYEKVNPSAVFIKFIIESLAISGYGLNFKKCNGCGKSLDDQNSASLIYESGGVLCHGCGQHTDSVKLSASEWQTLKQIVDCDIDSLAVLNDQNFSREILVSLMKDMTKQFYFRTSEKLKSLDKYF